MQTETPLLGAKVRLRQPPSPQAAGGVKRPSGKVARCGAPHLPHTNSISVTSGWAGVARTTVPRTLTSRPIESALMEEMVRKARGWLASRTSTLQGCWRAASACRVAATRTRNSTWRGQGQREAAWAGNNCVQAKSSCSASRQGGGTAPCAAASTSTRLPHLKRGAGNAAERLCRRVQHGLL